jgi:hypothetical protein
VVYPAKEKEILGLVELLDRERRIIARTLGPA